MEIIFIKDVKGQGKKGEIKEVKDGYAQNYLIKNHLAVQKNNQNLQAIKKEQAKEDEIEKFNIKEAEEIKKSLEKVTLNFKLKAGEHDKVFGSVSSKQIKEELDKKGFNINKNQINIEKPLSTLGIYKVEIIIYKKTTANIQVKITK